MMTRFRYFLALGLAAIPAGFGLAAVPTSPAAAQTVTKTYTAGPSVQAGMIIRLDAEDGARVLPATKTDMKSIHGVVVLPNDAPLALSEATTERQVYVATSGTFKVLVSDENGPVLKDDFITVSSIDGVGMRAGGSPEVVAAKALSNFDGRTEVKSRATVQDSDGNDRVVRFGYVDANINVNRNPPAKEAAPTLPGFLRSAAEAVADKQVSPLRVYLSLAVMLFTTVITLVIMVTGVRSSLTALGRNPLARKNIMRNLMQVVMIGIMILIVGLSAVYLLLKF